MRHLTREEIHAGSEHVSIGFHVAGDGIKANVLVGNLDVSWIRGAAGFDEREVLESHGGVVVAERIETSLWVEQAARCAPMG